MYTKNIKGEIEESTNLHRSILFLKIDLISGVGLSWGEKSTKVWPNFFRIDVGK